MSAAYRAAILKHLPKVDVVFDHLLSLHSTLRAAFGWVPPFGRLPVIKLVNEKIDDLRRALQREADILGKKYLKGTRYLLLASEARLRPSKPSCGIFTNRGMGAGSPVPR